MASLVAAAAYQVNDKDRQVIGAAVAGDAQVVVTNDRKLRQELERRFAGPRPLTADEFATQLAIDSPGTVLEVVDSLVAKRTARPVTTTQEFIEALRTPFPAMVAAITNDTPVVEADQKVHRQVD